ncbi:hypothetical protein QJS04_geneDACA014736 [Acorus gramineus]|uniref:Uncharacterized protein n=1 Tax=Acorus gramineus TaxID=55184 RepID=A0AAV9BPS6_ACOGR|nr:hypothetical protein QJS04_geneDACA014736 [Acorus gramineus]
MVSMAMETYKLLFQTKYIPQGLLSLYVFWGILEFLIGLRIYVEMLEWQSEVKTQLKTLEDSAALLIKFIDTLSEEEHPSDKQYNQQMLDDQHQVMLLIPYSHSRQVLLQCYH